jgi:hypothetical protein
MIGVAGKLIRTQIVNAPITPVFSAPGAMSSNNTLSGSGSFQFQFNATKRTCTTSAAGSVSGSGASSFQYFNSGELINAEDYEVMVTLGTNAGSSNIAAAGGSASLSVWITLSTSPLFIFSCSDRRGGSRPVNITIRHKIETSFTATTAITLTQTSDAVSPIFSGFSGTTTLTRTTTISYLGIYIDNATSANNGRIRTYKNTTIDSNTGFTFSTGSIPESEYECMTESLTVTPGGALSFGGLGGWVGISTLRAASASESSYAGRYFASDAMAAGTGTMRLSIRHKLDQSKSGFVDKTFQTV